MSSLTTNAKQRKAWSHALSQLLRHKLVEARVPYQPDGFARLDDVLAKGKRVLRGLTLAQVKEVVEADDKKRYSLRQDDEGVWWIRANQGHSVPGLDFEQLLVPCESVVDLPDTIVHGTFYQFWKSIKAEGLCRMSRNHVHFATGLPQDDNVVSGMRNTAELWVFLDAQAALDAGCRLYRSANDVVLTPGLGSRGVVPPSCFAKVVDARTGDVIFPVLADAGLSSPAEAHLEVASNVAEGGQEAAAAAEEGA